jgi:carbonic anhydrase
MSSQNRPIEAISASQYRCLGRVDRTATRSGRIWEWGKPTIDQDQRRTALDPPSFVNVSRGGKLCIVVRHSRSWLVWRYVPCAHPSGSPASIIGPMREKRVPTSGVVSIQRTRHARRVASSLPLTLTGAISARQPQLQISWAKRPDKIANNGHTIQLSFAESDTLQMGGRKYKLQQFHFHHPSEHLVEGKRFAMEAHFVHSAADALAVVAVLMVAGKPNAVFRKIVSTMPLEEGPPVPADPAIDLSQLLPAQRAYFHYEGSLTTPPCSETVDWIVLSHPVEVGGDDIARFAKLYPMNARPVQQRDRRFILSSGPR